MLKHKLLSHNIISSVLVGRAIFTTLITSTFLEYSSWDMSHQNSRCICPFLEEANLILAYYNLPLEEVNSIFGSKIYPLSKSISSLAGYNPFFEDVEPM